MRTFHCRMKKYHLQRLKYFRNLLIFRVLPSCPATPFFRLFLMLKKCKVEAQRQNLLCESLGFDNYWTQLFVLTVYVVHVGKGGKKFCTDCDFFDVLVFIRELYIILVNANNILLTFLDPNFHISKYRTGNGNVFDAFYGF